MELPRLKEWRERRGFTQRGLAAEAGVAPRSIAGAELGETGARPSTALKLAQALKVQPEDLMDLEVYAQERKARTSTKKAPAPKGPGRRKEQKPSKYLRVLRVYLYRLSREWLQNPPTPDEVKPVVEILQVLDDEGVFAELETPGSTNEQVELDLIRTLLATLKTAAGDTDLDREFERIVEGTDWSQQSA